MFKKVTLPKLSSRYLKVVPLQFLEDQLHAQAPLNRLESSPRHSIYQQHPYSSPKTQKLLPINTPILAHSKLTSLNNSYNIFKENLLDLDLYYNLEFPKNCQNDKQKERTNIIIKAKKNTQPDSKHKETSLGSTDNSLEAPQMVLPVSKNATDSPQTKLNSYRGKSYTKNYPTCRIVNSKKLPFDIRPNGLRKKNLRMQEMQLDISIIETKIQSQDNLQSQQSLQNFVACL